MNHIAFPGLGLSFDINPNAFTIFGLHVQWYGILITLGIILAFILFLWRAKHTEGIAEDDVYNVTLFAVPIAIIGARLTYVITSLDKYQNFSDIFKVWEGGLAIYGGIIFGAATVVVYSRIRKIKMLRVFDAICPAVMVGQILGRWGNFANAEAYGWSEGVENLPWRMQLDRVYIDGVYRPDIQFVHPTFLYESLWNLLGLIIISLLYRKKKCDGEILCLYLMWYGVGRGCIELLRTDSLRVGGVKLFVVLGFASFVIFGALLVWLLHRSKSEKSELKAYAAAYGIDSYDTTSVKPLTDNSAAEEQSPLSDTEPVAQNEIKLQSEGAKSRDPEALTTPHDQTATQTEHTEENHDDTNH